MSTGGKTVPSVNKISSSGNPRQENVVTNQMNTWLKSLYDYYAERSQAENGAVTAAPVAQIMQKVIAHVNSIAENLRASYPAPSPSEGCSFSSSVAKVQEKTIDKIDGQVVKSSEEQSKGKGTRAEGNVSSLAVPPGSTSHNKEPSSGRSISNQRIECRICLESVSEVSGRKFALLEQCDHPYCEPCVRSLLDHNGHGAEPIKCPTCRTASARIIVRETFLSSGPEKTALFGSVLCCPPHQISAESRADSEDDELTVIDEIGSLMTDAIVVEEDDWDHQYSSYSEALADTDTYTDTYTAETEYTEYEDSVPESSDDFLEYFELHNSSPSFGSVHSSDVNFSIQIDGRPLNVIVDETAALLDTWSLEDDSQTNDETESTAYEEDYVTSYNSWDDETDHSFSF